MVVDGLDVFLYLLIAINDGFDRILAVFLAFGQVKFKGCKISLMLFDILMYLFGVEFHVYLKQVSIVKCPRDIINVKISKKLKSLEL